MSQIVNGNINWVSIADDVTLNSGDQVRINAALDCGILSFMPKSDIVNAVAAETAVSAVLDIVNTAPWYNIDPIAGTIGIIVKPQQGVSAGDLRNAINTALSSVNSQKMIPCSGFTVGTIERGTPGSALQPTTTQTISLVALAVIAVVVVFLIVQVKEAI